VVVVVLLLLLLLLLLRNMLSRHGFLLNNKSLQCQMLHIYSTEVPIFLIIITKHFDTFAPSCHEFRNSIAAEIGLLCSQPYTNSVFPVIPYFISIFIYSIFFLLCPKVSLFLIYLGFIPYSYL
jgi:hypothetical protein